MAEWSFECKAGRAVAPETSHSRGPEGLSGCGGIPTLLSGQTGWRVPSGEGGWWQRGSQGTGEEAAAAAREALMRLGLWRRRRRCSEGRKARGGRSSGA